MRGTQLYWWLRRLAGKSPSLEVQATRPHRHYVCEAVLKCQPKSVFDFGCGNGANLYLLTRRRPDLMVAGIDPVAPEVWTGRKHVKGTLNVGSDTTLASIESDSFDVSLSDGVIFYLPPQKATQAIANLLRISSRAVVLSTWHGKPGKDDEAWIYDYEEIASNLNARVTIESYPLGAWTDARWKQYGALVTLTK